MSSSSPSSASEDTELLSGLPLLMRTLWRCATRYSTLERWEREEIVPPTLSTWERHRLFLLLQTPGQLQFDADEFLVGAKHAIEQLLLTSKTREFSQFVAGDLASSAAAERLRSWCTPRGFTFHENAARLALERGMVVEAEHVEVTRVQLHECRLRSGVGGRVRGRGARPPCGDQRDHAGRGARAALCVGQSDRERAPATRVPGARRAARGADQRLLCGAGVGRHDARRA
ncbi:hypothetical protein PINS_up022325 [Pythium insidiosum]|nr:hypothetical protein PINS_up022325 [Pythium insidiosum]